MLLVPCKVLESRPPTFLRHHQQVRVNAAGEPVDAEAVRATLEREFKQLGAVAGDQSIEWKLLQLKEKMQLGPASGSKPQQALKPGQQQSSQPHTDIVKDAVLEEDH